MKSTDHRLSLPKLTLYDWDGSKLIEVKRQPAHLRDDEGRLVVHAEDGSGCIDYYGEFRGGDPYIHPELETWAEARGLYWEWRDPGSIVLYD